jgi:CheY-like chemotaxis protein
MAEDLDEKHILLIDDDTSLLVTLSDFLRFEGYDVVTAESGEQGLKKLETMAPDLVILDMSMQGMGGIGFLREITMADGKPKYPVLVLTARANMAEFFANVPVDGFVAKPCDPDDLLMEVSRIIFLRSGGSDGKKLPDQPDQPKVLVGEDDDRRGRALLDAFTAAGYRPFAVARGPDVIEQAILKRPDVIVVKRVFSKMNGDAVAELLQEMPQTRGIPVVLYDQGVVGPHEILPRTGASGICRVVRTHEPESVVAAVRDVLSHK